MQSRKFNRALRINGTRPLKELDVVVFLVRVGSTRLVRRLCASSMC